MMEVSFLQKRDINDRIRFTDLSDPSYNPAEHGNVQFAGICMYTCVYIYTYIYTHIYIYIYVYPYIRSYSYIHTYIHTRTYILIRWNEKAESSYAEWESNNRYSI